MDLKCGILSLLVLILTLPIDAAAEGKKTRRAASPDVLPRLSPIGYKRLKQNIDAINKNMKLVETNLETIKKNIEVIEKEMGDLDSLAEENTELIKNYQVYLKKAKGEETRNKQAQDRLVKWRKRLLASVENNTPQAKSSLKRANDEIQNREMWQKDADAKKIKAQNLLRELKGNQSKIRAKKNALKVEISLWKKKAVRYKQSLKDMQKNSSNYQKILARSPYF